MKDDIDLFNEHDERTARREAEYAKVAPRCCCCEEAILDNEAVYYEGDWFCRNPECMKEFFSDMESKYKKEIA